MKYFTTLTKIKFILSEMFNLADEEILIKYKFIKDFIELSKRQELDKSYYIDKLFEHILNLKYDNYQEEENEWFIKSETFIDICLSIIEFYYTYLYEEKHKYKENTIEYEMITNSINTMDKFLI